MTSIPEFTPNPHDGHAAGEETRADGDERLDDVPGYREDLQAHAPAVQLLLVGGPHRAHGFRCSPFGTAGDH